MTSAVAEAFEERNTREEISGSVSSARKHFYF